jgi:hypothetical protein
MAETGKRIAIVCGTCGSDEVSRDAWADWDIGRQEWALRTVFDQGFCHRCDCESRLIDVELTPTSS